MKKLRILIFVLLCCNTSIAQDSVLGSARYLSMQNGMMQFKSVYTYSGEATEIKNKMIVHLIHQSSINILEEWDASTSISIDNIIIPMINIPYKVTDLPAILKCPSIASAIIQFKDDKYMVSITKLHTQCWTSGLDHGFVMPVYRSYEDYLYPKNFFYSEKYKKKNKKALTYIETYLYNLFVINNSIYNEDW